MNEIDVRLAYQRDTGDLPLWTTMRDGSKKYSFMPKKNWRYGVPTTVYGLWMEEKLGGNSRQLRDAYYKKYSIHPTYKGWNRNTVFFREYSEWLEIKIYSNPKLLKWLKNID
ncbi:MAG: hypothetical protein PHF86_10325 [Candidatus Nanoarchaeia archaeon]|nr:hypothetical protein [Candidatus Nanoarchaeia archaeon]